MLVPAVALLGLPHGALDYVIGAALLRRLGRGWVVAFGAVYLGLVAVTAAAWFVAPLPSLLFFLAVSLWHFGIGDVSEGLSLGAHTRWWKVGASFEAVARGAFFLTAAVYFHTKDVTAMFAALTEISSEQLLASAQAIRPSLLMVNGAMLSVVLAHHLGGWAEGLEAHGRAALEVVALIALFCLATPLVAFVVYFCFWHSVRHGLRLAAQLDSSSPAAAFRAFVRQAWPTTLAAVTMGAAVFVFFAGTPTTDGILRVVFIGLSALTVPHVLLTWLSTRFANTHTR